MYLRPIIILTVTLSMGACAKLIPGRVGPAADITVAITPERIALGKKLAEGIMACGSCHTTGSFAGDPQQDMHLAGDVIITEGNGKLAVPNITPDKETGIGNWTDGEIIRAFTKGLSRDNRLLLPTMPWATFGAVLTNEESEALVAYLRTGPEAVNHTPEESELNTSTKIIVGTGMIYNIYAKEDYFNDYVPSQATAIDRGRRLAYLGACVDCHAYAPGMFPDFGESLGGGYRFELPEMPTIMCANLTPDMETGIGSFDDEALYNAIKYGMRLRPLPDTEMVRWPMMPRMTYHTSLTDDEIGDLIAFFRAMPAVENDIDAREAKLAE